MGFDISYEDGLDNLYALLIDHADCQPDVELSQSDIERFLKETIENDRDSFGVTRAKQQDAIDATVIRFNRRRPKK